MSGAVRSWLLLSALLLAACAGLGLRVLDLVGASDPGPRARLELARVRPTRVDPGLARRLAESPEPIDIVYFTTPRERLPFEQRELRDEVEELLRRLERAGAGKLSARVVEPSVDPAAAALAADLGVGSVRVRTLAQDVWSERELDSTLSIGCGARARTNISGLLPEHLGALQGWIAAHLDEARWPSRPTFALIAPQGFSRLEASLAARGELARAERPSDASQADLLLWIEPGSCQEADLRELEERVERGQSTLIAGAAWPRDGERAQAFERILARLGLALLPGRVCDERAEIAPSGAADGGRQRPARVLSIAPQQDFRGLAGQPNGSLLFDSAAALVPDAARLQQLNLSWRVLASAGPAAWLDESGAADSRMAQSAPRAALAGLLTPLDGRRGWVAVLGSASVLADADWERADLAHAPLERVLVDSLTSRERRVAARAAAVRPAPSRELGAGARLAWRALCVLGPALGFALAARWGRRERTARLGLGLRRRAWWIALAASAVLLAVGLLDRAAPRGWDLTRAGRHGLDPFTQTLARALEGDLTATWLLPDDVPDEFGDLPRRGLDLLEALRPHLAGSLRLQRLDAARLQPSRRAQLAALGLRRVSLTSQSGDQTRVRELEAGLLLAHGAREVLLAFPSTSSFEHLELRLALALQRLDGVRAPRVAVASDTPRLAPAEAHAQFQTRGLFAPGGVDVFAQARACLAENDFEVLPVSTSEPAWPADVDLFLWLQPRRGITPLLPLAAEHLRRGGHALVAMQHFRVLARSQSQAGRTVVFWPEPQFPDFSELYLERMGLRFVREVLCDSPGAALPVATELRDALGAREFRLETGAQSFHLRAAAARFDPELEYMRGLSDQLFESGNRAELDRERIERSGLRSRVLCSTSPRAWSIDWQGGHLDPEAVAAAPSGRELAGPQPLAVELEGPFPAWSEDPAQAPAADPAGARGRLIVLGASSIWRNERLRLEEFRGDHLLLNLCAELAAGPQLARLAARRTLAPSFEAPAPRARVWMRLAGLGAWPALMALLWTLSRAWSARKTAP